MYKVKRWISHIYHRIKYGVSYNDTWGLADYVDSVILEGLKKFKKVNNCHPISLSEKQWDDIIDKMIEGWELICLYKYSGEPIEGIEEEFYTKEQERKIKRARKLYDKHRGSLWR